MLIATASMVIALALAAPPAPTPSPVDPAATPERHRMRSLRLVAIDPGHGGDNRGCLGVDGTWEKEATLDIAARVGALLTAQTTARARLTRRDDRPLGLAERSQLADRWNADAFLSIHLNADAFGQGSGIETWFLAPPEEEGEGQALVEAEEHGYADSAPVERVATQAAEAIARDADLGAARIASQVLAEAVVEGMGALSGARVRGVRQARFGVLKGATMPAIVVECGFFSHAEEGMRLTEPEYRQRIAQGIVDGLVAYDARLGSADAPEEAAR
ncbi:MAG: N-acetylmuramoyl-L-alanine amidase [Myxococcota bacterium]